MQIREFSPTKFGTIFFCGIGGIGMSGIAEILYNLGCKVQGSDISDNANVKRLRDLGIEVFVGQKESNVTDASVVVRSSAVKDDNPEVVAARKLNIPVIARADMLKEIMFLKNCVTIAGTHGKTTTTSMVAQLFDTAGLDPTVINGGILNSCGTNAYLGSGEWLVAEADESDGSFNKLPANIAVVTNIDPEHMEFYGSFSALRQAFINFIEKVPFYGFAVLCIDHPTVREITSEVKDRRIVTYGFSDDAMVQGYNLRNNSDGVMFDVKIKLSGKEKELKDLLLPMFGEHNVLNSLAMIAIGCELDICDKVKESLQKFMGVKRRLTITGKVNDITVIDDYGHHPTEIKASIRAVRAMSQNHGRVIAVLQPHRYSRVYDLFQEFSHAFVDADQVYVTDIFAAGESPINGIDKDSLVKAIKDAGNDNVYPVSNIQDLAGNIKGGVKDGDYIICLGAGDITKYANQLPGDLEKVL